MFRELRESYGLTRHQLSEMTNRSPNYLLKAESLTFPTPPIALLDLYTREVSPSAALSEVWEPQDRDILISQYRDAQRRKRELWLNIFEPYLDGATFCKLWRMRYYESPDEQLSPTEYRVSQGLCIPAPAVYRAEKYGTISAPIKTALSDLVDYVASGRYQATDLGANTGFVVGDVLRLAERLGVRYVGV